MVDLDSIHDTCPSWNGRQYRYYCCHFCFLLSSTTKYSYLLCGFCEWASLCVVSVCLFLFNEAYIPPAEHQYPLLFLSSTSTAHTMLSWFPPTTRQEQSKCILGRQCVLNCLGYTSHTQTLKLTERNENKRFSQRTRATKSTHNTNSFNSNRAALCYTYKKHQQQQREKSVTAAATVVQDTIYKNKKKLKCEIAAKKKEKKGMWMFFYLDLPHYGSSVCLNILQIKINANKLSHLLFLSFY